MKLSVPGELLVFAVVLYSVDLLGSYAISGSACQT